MRDIFASLIAWGIIIICGYVFLSHLAEERQAAPCEAMEHWTRHNIPARCFEYWKIK